MENKVIITSSFTYHGDLLGGVRLSVLKIEKETEKNFIVDGGRRLSKSDLSEFEVHKFNEKLSVKRFITCENSEEAIESAIISEKELIVSKMSEEVQKEHERQIRIFEVRKEHLISGVAHRVVRDDID